MGIDYLHEDLKDNYNAKASYDFSSNDPYPYPRYTDTWFNRYCKFLDNLGDIGKAAIFTMSLKEHWYYGLIEIDVFSD
ncbi:hypothetical protein KUTeg_013691 [Tegillarca granosa]|uniref:Uncharacterized protein n=1 Tax=Tegillarca granosa TaxID=220873 RepID=A0ABQ9EYX9_TEGGR|nr:hypothetical protein KUTeg_013691 [Tegillarca granosa]